MTEKEEKRLVHRAQTVEIPEHVIYSRLARLTKNEHNREIMGQISQDEWKHYQFWVEQTGREAKPNRFKIFLYVKFDHLGLHFLYVCCQKLFFPGKVLRDAGYQYGGCCAVVCDRLVGQAVSWY